MPQDPNAEMDEPGDEERTAEPREPAEEPEEPAMDPDAVYGLEILELEKGPALAARMKVGDIIMAVNGTPTPDFESLRAALEASGPRAEFEFINVDNGELERTELAVVDTRIGAEVQQVVVELTIDD